MAKFGEEVDYASHCVKNFFRLPATAEDQGIYIINEGNNSIIQIIDKKLQKSWNLKHPHIFTSPAVLDKDTSSIYCVSDNNVLMKLPVEDDSMKNNITCKFEEPIFAVLKVSSERPILLFPSGRFFLCKSLVELCSPTGETVLDSDHDMIWAEAVKSNSGIIVVFIAFSPKTKHYKLHHFTITEGLGSHYCSQPLGHKGHSLQNWCLNRDTRSFLSIWSNGEIFNVDLQKQLQSPLLTIPKVKSGHLLAIDCLDLNHVAVLKATSNNNESSLEIWDSKFAVLKGRKIVKTETPKYLQLFSTISSIFLSYNEVLIEIPYDIEKSSLASAIGKSSTIPAKIQESSWNSGNLSKVTTEQNVNEKMDTSGEKEELDSLEATALRLITEGSSYPFSMTSKKLLKMLSLAVRHKIESEETSFDADALLKIVFSEILSSDLSRMNLEDAMMTLKVLMNYLNDESPTKDHRPNDHEVFGWIILIVQSHMEAMLLSKDRDCQKVLKKLNECLLKKMKEYEDFENIQNLISVVKMKNVLPRKREEMYTQGSIAY